jgi:hypothetical protein
MNPQGLFTQDFVRRLLEIEKQFRDLPGKHQLFDIANEYTPAQFTGSQTDYDPGDYDVLRLSASLAIDISGIAGGKKGRFLELINVGSFNITLQHCITIRPPSGGECEVDMAKISAYPAGTPTNGDKFIFARGGQNYSADFNKMGVVQIVHTQTGAVATGTTVMPLDDTIPQITEGNEFFSPPTITPTSATNKLLIEVLAFLSHSVAGTMTGALFRDSVADALAVMAQYQDSNGGITPLFLRHEMTAGGVSAITFHFRAGGSVAGTATFNGFGGNRKFGGVIASSIRITEYKP